MTSGPRVSVSPEQALAATAKVRALEAPRLLDVTLAALGRVQRAEVEEVTLGRAEACELLVHVQELRRDLGGARATLERRTDDLRALRRDLEAFVDVAQGLLSRMPTT